MHSNKFRDMKRILILFIFVGQVVFGQQLHVASYNIRYANPADEQHGNGWALRSPGICDMIAYEAFDLIGLQEVLKNQLDDLLLKLSDKYAYVGGGRDDGKISGEYAPVLYKKSRFKLLDSGIFWLSTTPNVPSVGWDAKYPRICTWVQLQDRESRKQLFFLNTHFDHVGKQARVESARMIVEWIKKQTKKNRIFILTGDFNVDQRSPSYQELIKNEVLRDSFEVAEIRMAQTGTINSFDIHRWTDQRIDHVLVSSGVKVQRYGLLTNLYWGCDAAGKRQVRLSSDHFPVSVYLQIL